MADSLRLALTAGPVANGESAALTVAEVLEVVGTTLTAGEGEELFTATGVPISDLPKAELDALSTAEYLAYLNDFPEIVRVALSGHVHVQGQGVGWRHPPRGFVHPPASVIFTLFPAGEAADTPEELNGPYDPWVPLSVANTDAPSSVVARWFGWSDVDKTFKAFVGIKHGVGDLVVDDLVLTVSRHQSSHVYDGYSRGYFLVAG